MKTRHIIQSLIFTIIIGFALPAPAQDQQSIGKVPMTTEKPTVNYGITNVASAGTIAYGHSSLQTQFLSMPIPAGTPFTLIAPLVAGGFFGVSLFWT